MVVRTVKWGRDYDLESSILGQSFLIKLLHTCELYAFYEVYAIFDDVCLLQVNEDIVDLMEVSSVASGGGKERMEVGWDISRLFLVFSTINIYRLLYIKNIK